MTILYSVLKYKFLYFVISIDVAIAETCVGRSFQNLLAWGI